MTLPFPNRAALAGNYNHSSVKKAEYENEQYYRTFRKKSCRLSLKHDVSCIDQKLIGKKHHLDLINLTVHFMLISKVKGFVELATMLSVSYIQIITRIQNGKCETFLHSKLTV